jgi:hypothetical protein
VFAFAVRVTENDNNDSDNDDNNNAALTKMTTEWFSLISTEFDGKDIDNVVVGGRSSALSRLVIQHLQYNTTTCSDRRPSTQA